MTNGAGFHRWKTTRVVLCTCTAVCLTTPPTPLGDKCSCYYFYSQLQTPNQFHQYRINSFSKQLKLTTPTMAVSPYVKQSLLIQYNNAPI